MVYASRAPDDATLARYYREFSKYDHPQSVGELSAADLDRAEVAAAFTRHVLAPGARVLDVGCSIGLYLSALARSGSFEVRGLDPSPTSAEVARRFFDVAVDVGDAYAYDDYAAFDGIALLAVLEHLRDPRRLFETLASRMKPGATLIVEVPNADFFGDHPAIGRLSEPFGEFSNEHINFFGDAARRQLARQAGLAWVASEEFPYLIGVRGLIAAFRKDDGRVQIQPVADSHASVRRYVDASSAAMRDVESRLARARVAERPIVLYGAGSHSARILAQGSLGGASIEVVLDRNPHLTGQTIGGLRIATPETLRTLPALPVVVSSFNAMHAISDYLQKHHDNEIVTLYPAEAATDHADRSTPARAPAPASAGQPD
jgi:SAM-dependent methyltransferase